MFPFVRILGCKIPSYLIMAMSGIIISTIISILLTNTKRYKQLSKMSILKAIIYVFVGAVFGAKAFQIVGIIYQNLTNNRTILYHLISQCMRGVGVFYGGLTGGGGALILYSKLYKISFNLLTDVLIPGVLIFNIFGRIGCFLAGCCYGKEANWGLIFSDESLAPAGVRLVPVQLFEAALNLVILLVIGAIGFKTTIYGANLPIYLMCYSVGRFVIEFFRGDENRGVYFFSISQWMMFIVLPLGIFLLFSRMKESRRNTLFADV